MRIAIYARKSVQKSENAVSIESQIERCKQRANQLYNNPDLVIFEDVKSGKNINRPGFLRMMSQIDAGLIDKLMVYKLDRISRSVNDFYSIFERCERAGCRIELVENNIDTDSNIGRLLMNLLANFAQLERENISDRVSTALLSAAKNDGRWMLGHAPIGYKIVRENGISQLQPDEKTVQAVKDLFHKFATDNSISLYELTRWLKENYGIQKNTGSISLILRNEKYAKADTILYRYFKNLGVNFLNEKEEWDGSNSCCLINTQTHEIDGTKKKLPPTEWKCYISNHQGIVGSKEWLLVQKRLQANKRKPVSSGLGNNKNKNRWGELNGGVVKCSRCGSSVRVVFRTVKGKEYLNLSCSRKYQIKGNGNCGQCFYKIKPEQVRENVAIEIQKVLDNFRDITQSKKEVIRKTLEKKLTYQVEQDKLINSLKSISGITTQRRITEEIEKLQKEIDKCDESVNNLYLSAADSLILRLFGQQVLTKEELKKMDPDKWDYLHPLSDLDYRSLTTEQKKSVVDLLVECVFLNYDGSVVVCFKSLPEFTKEFNEEQQEKFKKAVEKIHS